MADSVERFGDLLAMFDLVGGSWGELVAGAANVVAEGFQTPVMVVLASQPAGGPRNGFELAAYVEAARQDLGMRRLDEVATAVRATQAQIRKWRAGALSDAGLLSFVYWTAGHGTPDLARLCSLFGWMEEQDYYREDRLEIHDDIDAAAELVMAAFDPWARQGREPCRPPG